ncbi:MAG: 5-formyltetrahydrofolate cyclo-ligase [Prevotellaceae bacterium]|nr:5-formyltetrahydrofolate cyclo-ligase [Prevotellaceae bacterium]
MTKQELRQWVRQRKAEHSSEELRQLSLDICNALRRDPRWQASRTALLYHALPDEVCLSPLIEEGFREGKRILLPVVSGESLQLREYEGEQSLSRGPFGIMEPTGREFTDLTHIDLALIPALAYDPQGNRLGRGRGYYDRLLPHLARNIYIGVCFPFQLVAAVPHCEHDWKVSEVFVIPHS